ncbi:hypothetical protein [Luteibacter sahnii]|uniref:hypothetical protein n=1 Tax=Luteibacter sahnii TaxID=3021977 RepID=UPI002A6B890B|nr:hypothetical protein [Luteibacter sp. PPL193]MDY1548771.1 hypothetical protein [Luteibacter sp. PPL193]
MSVKGYERVGTFDYAPAKSGKIKPNQIRNTAPLGNVMLEKPVHEYFEKAVFTESRFVGIDVSGSGPLVHGTIDDFVIDDLGYNVDWTLAVTYVVDGDGPKPCFHSQKKLARRSTKFVNPFGALNELLKDNIELAFKDPNFVSCIGSPAVAARAGAGSAAGLPGTIVSPTPTPTPTPASIPAAPKADDGGAWIPFGSQGQ